MGKIISVCTQKGGVGKTFTTFQLGACLSAKGKKVLLIDLDQQCNLTDCCNADKNGYTIYDALTASAEKPVTLKDTIQHLEHFDIVPASQELSKISSEFQDYTIEMFYLDIILTAKNAGGQSIKDQYDYIIIDNNPSRNILLNMNYMTCDYIIGVTSATQAGQQGISMLYNDIKSWKDQGKITIDGTTYKGCTAEFLAIILTPFKPFTTMGKIFDQNIRNFIDLFHLNCLFETVRTCADIDKSAMIRKPLIDVAPKGSNALIDFNKIADDVIAFTDKQRVGE